ncbi:hypothetical protein MNBD_UNCLBAC01-761 [hydrothermal vent metagenome]|uniref:TonB C-terminal domain-containing protein n=1 Tax=hydrothermal vent metagenome TaxID=652676 RepID=A0A3B1D4Q7_9ZZZZ
MGNRLFQISLIVSLLIHSILIIYLSHVKQKSVKKISKPIEVVYREIEMQKILKPKPSSKVLKLIKKNESKHHNVKILSKKHDMFSPIGKHIRDISKFSGRPKLDRKYIPKITPRDTQRKISIPLLKSEKITNPRYLSYNQSIRARIRQRAYTYVNHVNFVAGNVYLTFILASDGLLKNLQIIEEKTSANNYLRQTGLRSIQESSPFPPFPQDLKYPELTFNVVISFEVKE